MAFLYVCTTFRLRSILATSLKVCNSRKAAFLLVLLVSWRGSSPRKGPETRVTTVTMQSNKLSHKQRLEETREKFYCD